MISVPARRVKQFGVEFYQAGLTAKDIDRLVKFEVLGYSGGPQAETPKKRNAARARVNWDMLEKRISESETAYQRPVIRRKIDELAAYYRECKDAATLPAIPGAVIITSEKRFTFTPVAGHHDLGLLQIPEEHGVLRVLDGQHRLLALHALSQAGEAGGIEVPAVLFDSLDARQVVELFVTINAKHTRLNPSHIISLAGRKLYPDPNQALAHDVIRSLNEDDTSPLHGEIKMLGTGRGRVSQAPLAEEIVDFLETVEKVGSSSQLQALRGGAFDFLARGQDLVDHAPVLRLVCIHEVVAIEGFFNLFERTARVLHVDFIEAALHLDDVAGVALDVRCLPLETAGRLVHHDAGVRGCETHSLFTGSQKQRAHGGRIAQFQYTMDSSPQALSSTSSTRRQRSPRPRTRPRPSRRPSAARVLAGASPAVRAMLSAGTPCWTGTASRT